MKKWEITNNGYFYGEATPNGIGIMKWQDGDYYIGSWKDNARTGWGILKCQNSVKFGNFDDGQFSYPMVSISNKNVLDVMLERLPNGHRKHVIIWLNDGDWRFDEIDENNDLLENAVEYHHDSQNILMIKYNNETHEADVVETIPKKFYTAKPIISHAPLDFEKDPDFSRFEWDDGVNNNNVRYFRCDDSKRVGGFGIGAISWNNDEEFCIGQWKDGYRTGWSLYHWENSTEVFYTHEGERAGLSVVFFKAGAISITVVTKDGRKNEICYNGSTLSYSGTVPSCLDRDGPGISVSCDCRHVKFVNFVGDEFDEQSVSAHYALSGSRIISVGHNSFEDTNNIRDEEEDEEDNQRILRGGPRREDTRVDIADDTPITNEKDVDELKDMIGLEDVKNEVKKIKAYLLKNERNDVSVHMAFLGKAGTGKSTVANLIADILNKNGALPERKLIEISAKELASPYAGESAKRVYDAFERALGGVLFIDDAHALDSSKNGYNSTEALDTLVKALNKYKNQLCVIVCGHEDAVKDLFKSSHALENKIKFVLEFPDLNKEQLIHVLNKNIKKKGYTIEEEALNLIIDVVDQASYSEHFANAKEAIAILERVILAQNLRTVANKADLKIIKEDVLSYMKEFNVVLISEHEVGTSDARKDLEKLIGLEDIKTSIDDLVSYFSFNKGKPIDFHMSFNGNPGTGKTEVARILGRLLHEEGLLPSDTFIEATRNDFVAQYIGQTTPKTREVISRAMGGVLYIDEAYSLAMGGERDFGAEAVTELLKIMEDKRGQFCVILAGYTKEMQQLFEINPGFKSRVKFHMNFPDYTDDELYKIGELFLKKDEYEMNEENLKLVIKLVGNMRKMPNFANARSVRETLSKIEIKQAGRIRKLGLNTRELTREDIIAVFGKKTIEEIEAQKEEVLSENKMINLAHLQELISKIKKAPYLEMADYIAETVVAIKTTGSHAGESSGFIISDDGYVVTCAHCVNGADAINVRYRVSYKGHVYDSIYPAKLIAIDPKDDVAVIKLLTDDKFDYLRLAEDNDEQLSPLSEVYLLGYPFGVSRFDKMSINVGKVASYQKGKNGEPDQINLDISAKSGNSGSCVINALTGEVIGILCGSSLSHSGSLTEEINYCRPISYVWKLIKNNQ